MESRGGLTASERSALLNAVTDDYALESQPDEEETRQRRSSGSSVLRSPEKPHPHHHRKKGPQWSDRPYYEVFAVVLFVFSGYGCLFALQRKVKQHIGISDENDAGSTVFGVAVSSLYIGNLVFRLGHNVFFFFCSPRNRVIISIVGMFCSMSLISVVLLTKPGGHSLAFVFIAYFLGGLGIGTFESNLLSSIAPLGKSTKMIAIIAIPVGITLITIGAFLLMGLAGLQPVVVFLTVAGGNVLSLLCWLIRIYRDAGDGNYLTLREFFGQFRSFREWLPSVWQHALALTFDMFCVSLFSPGVILYIYDKKTVAFPWFGSELSSDIVKALYNLSFFLGDFSSRRIFFPVRIVSPFLFLGFSLLGIVCGLSYISELVFFCGFFVAFGNGSIYAQANKKIDRDLDEHHSVTAFSFWLFLGDVGSVAGSNLITAVSEDIRAFYHH